MRFGKVVSSAFVRYLITFFIGVIATLAWQSYGSAARAMIANSYPELGWLAPQAEPVAQNAAETIAPVAPSFDPQQLNAISVDLDAVRQSIDRIATSMTATQEQMSRTADRARYRVDDPSLARHNRRHKARRQAGSCCQASPDETVLDGSVRDRHPMNSAPTLVRPAPGLVWQSRAGWKLLGVSSAGRTKRCSRSWPARL